MATETFRNELVTLRKRGFNHPHVPNLRGGYTLTSSGNPFFHTNTNLLFSTTKGYAIIFEAPADGELEYVYYGVAYKASAPSYPTTLTFRVQGITGEGIPNGVNNGGSAVGSNLTGNSGNISEFTTRPTLVRGNIYSLTIVDSNDTPNWNLMAAADLCSANFPNICNTTDRTTWLKDTLNTKIIPALMLRISGAWVKVCTVIPPGPGSDLTFSNTTTERGIAITPIHDIALEGVKTLCDLDPDTNSWTISLYEGDSNTPIERLVLDSDLKGNTSGGTVDMFFPSTTKLLTGRTYYIGFHCPAAGGGLCYIPTKSIATYGDIRKAVFGHDIGVYTRTFNNGESWVRVDADTTPYVPVISFYNAGQYQ